MAQPHQAGAVTLRQAASALQGTRRSPDPGLRRVRQAFAAQLRRAEVPADVWDVLRADVARTLAHEPGADAPCSVSYVCARVGVLARNRALDARFTRSTAAG